MPGQPLPKASGYLEGKWSDHSRLLPSWQVLRQLSMCRPGSLHTPWSDLAGTSQAPSPSVCSVSGQHFLSCFELMLKQWLLEELGTQKGTHLSCQHVLDYSSTHRWSSSSEQLSMCWTETPHAMGTVPGWYLPGYFELHCGVSSQRVPMHSLVSGKLYVIIRWGLIFHVLNGEKISSYNRANMVLRFLFSFFIFVINSLIWSPCQEVRCWSLFYQYKSLATRFHLIGNIWIQRGITKSRIWPWWTKPTQNFLPIYLYCLNCQPL